MRKLPISVGCSRHQFWRFCLPPAPPRGRRRRRRRTGSSPMKKVGCRRKGWIYEPVGEEKCDGRRDAFRSTGWRLLARFQRRARPRLAAACMSVHPASSESRPVPGRAAPRGRDLRRPRFPRPARARARAPAWCPRTAARRAAAASARARWCSSPV